jgi:hypothetical protein
MSKEKALKIASLSTVDFAVYKTKRNLRSLWQKLSHEEWVSFCSQISNWLSNNAADEWDKQVIANDERKAQSDEDADIENVKKKRRK